MTQPYPPAQLQPGTQVDRYLIEGIVGEGAMAVVYRARHHELGSLHAIKQVKLPSNNIRERLLQEGRLQSSFKHPNVLSVTDLVTIYGAPALVMEFVEGPNLADLLENYQPSPAQRDLLARHIIKGVAAAHAHGLIHRDLKPANILIGVAKDGLIPKIADFGLAKLLEEDPSSNRPMTQVGATMGTPAYMAPEQIRDSSSVDERADVFSLGAILYELATGEICFQGGSLLDTLDKVCKGDYTSATAKNPDLPKRMSQTIEACLRVDRDVRIATVTEVFSNWCSDDSGAHIPVEGAQSMDFWPPKLLKQALDMAPELITVSSDTATGDTGAAPATTHPSNQDPSNPTIQFDSIGDPTLNTLGTAGETTAFGTMDADRRLRSSVPLVWAILGAILLGLIVTLVWQNPFETPSAVLNLVQLGAEATEADQQNFKAVEQALLDGEYPRAERLLIALDESKPDDPAVHYLLAINHYLRGRTGLAVKEGTLSVAFARANPTPMAEFLELADRSWREPDNRALLLPRWQQLLENHEEPLLHIAYTISARSLVGHPAMTEHIHKLSAQHPEWVALVTTELLILKEVGDDEAQLRVAQAAVERLPHASAIWLHLGAVQSRLGYLTKAEETLKRVLVLDGGLTAARTILAEIYIKQNAEVKRNEQLMFALSDTVAPSEQLNFLRTHGRNLSENGRLHEAHKVLNFCIDQSVEMGDLNTAAICASQGLGESSWLQGPSEQQYWIDRLRDISSRPEVDDSLRRFYAVQLLYSEAVIALSNDDMDRATALLGRVNNLAKAGLPFGAQHWFSQELRLDIALHNKDRVELERLMRDKRQQEGQAKKDMSCVTLLRESEIGVALEDPQRIIPALEQVVAGECIFPENRGTLLAIARVGLADALSRVGKPDEASKLMVDFRVDWYNPDEDLPLVQQATAVEEGLK